MDDFSNEATVTTTSGSIAKDRAIAQLVDAARKLFAERGPDAVPLRAVAKEAGVNYGLIYQYVGTKDDLLRLVFQSASTHYAQEFGRAKSANEAIGFLMRPRNSEYVRMLARSLLEGRDPARDPNVTAAVVTAMSLGWGLFGEFAMAISGVSDFSKEEVREVVIAIAERLVSGE